MTRFWFTAVAAREELAGCTSPGSVPGILRCSSCMGWPATGRGWRAQVWTLKPSMTVVMCDLPGHGLSRGTPAECTTEAYGTAVAQNLAALDAPPAILVGHSMGCRVVLAQTRTRPQAVAGLVLVDGSRIGAADPVATGQPKADDLVGDGYLRFMRSFFESMFAYRRVILQSGRRSSTVRCASPRRWADPC